MHLNVREDQEPEFYDAIGEEMGEDNAVRPIDDDPPTRERLPWLKDPSIKLGIWAIIKDNIGKDMTRIAVPVFFNDPTNLL